MKFHFRFPPSQLSHQLCISTISFGHSFRHCFLFIYNMKAVKERNGDDFLCRNGG
jgi:hypothetical protein